MTKEDMIESINNMSSRMKAALSDLETLEENQLTIQTINTIDDVDSLLDVIHDFIQEHIPDEAD